VAGAVICGKVEGQIGPKKYWKNQTMEPLHPLLLGIDLNEDNRSV
jgi:hypothetical protein